MAISTATQRNNLATAYGAAATHAALFVSNPGNTGAATGEVTGGSYVRKALTWAAPTDGSTQAVATFDVPGGVTVTHAAVTGGLTGANVLDVVSLTPQTFATAGTYTVTFPYQQS